jgi:hypothetical protein
MGYSPVLYLSKLNDKIYSKDQWIHVLQVVGLSKKDYSRNGAYKIYVWDINFIGPSRATRVIEMNENYEFTLGSTTIDNLVPLVWDDLEVARMIKKNMSFCSKRPGLCTTGNR